MNKKQQAQAVKLLRCAADLCVIDSSHGLYSVARLSGVDTWDTAPATGGSAFVWDLACRARNHVHANGYWLGYWHECLEAAARVEEGSFP